MSSVLVCLLICLFLVKFSPGSLADDCSAGFSNQYPQCSPLYHNISVSESLKKNKDVLQINCTDPEGSKMKWKITAGNTKKPFTISSSGMLRTKKRLNAEGTINPYLLFIEASDKGTPRLTSTVVVTIFITSTNDEAPLMVGLPQQVEVSENILRGSVIVHCSLVDSDSARLPEGLARVQILEGNEDNIFNLDSRTCALTLNKPLDFETMESTRLLFEAYELDVAAPLTTRQNVTINIVDFNDHPPNCSDYVLLLTVSEDTTSDTVLTSLNCSDVDVSDTLHYALAADSPDTLAVDNNTGVVTLAKPVDFENGVTNFDVIVHVYDVSSSPLTSTVIINVQVTDADDNIPQFDTDVIHIEVPEEWEVGRVIHTLTVTDEDTPGTYLSSPTFRVVSFDVNWFDVHPTTGMVMIKEVVDRESEHNVLLTVSVHSSDRSNDTSTILLNITISDTNDNRPRFNQTLYNGRVSKGAAVGTVVCDVIASDVDGDVIYSIDSNTFAINSTTGEIFLASAVDFETHTSYLFVVTATDDVSTSTTSYSSQALVRVEVEGVNEAPPIFQVPATDSEVRFVSENTVPGTALFAVSASDADSDVDGTVTYHLLQPNATATVSPFLLDVQQGTFTLHSPLDRESQDTYILVLQARDSSTFDPKSASVTLTVSVTDYNDNAPVCSHVGPLLVRSSVSVGDSLLTLSCSDRDLDNNSMTFAKVSGDVSGIFRVNANSGEVKLQRVPTLPQYELLIEVRDGGSPGLSTYTTVTFMVEDLFSFSNVPTVLELAEDTEVESVVLDINVTGSRLPVFFELRGGGATFTVQPSTGEIYLTSSLDRETRDTYELTMVASTAAGHSTTASVAVSVLDINDNKPIIVGTFNISVSENIPVPTVLQVFSAQDDDVNENGEVSFQLKPNSTGGPFSLSAGGTLSLVSVLDAEFQQLYEMVVIASDGGSPSLTSERRLVITVKDVDEFRPQFAMAGNNLALNLSEDTAVGAVVLHITADDADLSDDVRFDVISGNRDGTFKIDRQSGKLFLAKLLDREDLPEYELVVKVSNAKGENTTSTIAITIDDSNDNAPAFSKAQYIFEISQNAPSNRTVGYIAVVDKDEGLNAQFQLDIISGDADNIFGLKGQDIITTKAVNTSGVSSYILTLRASDKGSPVLSADVDVLIRVIPDNRPPQFLSHRSNLTIEENTLTGTVIYDFQATGRGASEGENGDLSYTITSGNQDLNFHVNEFTGQLYLIRDLDYEEQGVHYLFVRAQHRNDPDLYDVEELIVHVINLNDVSPTFDQLRYTWRVEEGEYRGSVIGKVSASDHDLGPFGQINYSLQSDPRFAINATTGEVMLSGQVNYEQHAYFLLSVTAIDDSGPASLTGTAAIFVHVTDINDHEPQFPDVGGEVKMPESAAVGSVVTVLLPRDGDRGNNSRLFCNIVSGNQEGKFSLDPDACVLTVSAQLDAESQIRYILTMTAMDRGTPPLTGTTSLTVHVTDDNDNAPRFINSTAHVQAARADPAGTEVYIAVATDADSGANGKVYFAFLHDHTQGVFIVIPTTGLVQTLTALSQAQDTYTLLLTATDRGYPAKTATLTLFVEVTPPLNPSPSSLTFGVPEHSSVGTLVGTLPAERNLTVLSRIISNGNYKAAFRVETRPNGNGVLKVAGPTDRETYPEYHLVVETRFRDVTGSDVTDTTNVIVMLSDINDHAPVFSQSEQIFFMVENLPAGTTVAHLEVSDKDEDLNGQITLTFSASFKLCDTYFNLTSNGDIVIKQSVDYEVMREVPCQVVAEDGGSPPKTSTTSFTATVTDVQEEEVQIKGETSSVFISLEIPFDSVPGRVIHTLSANLFGIYPSPPQSPSSAPQGDDSLSFLTLNGEGIFTVSQATGEVRVGQNDLLYDQSRYFQWVVCRYQRDGNESVETQLGLMRVDTFSMDQHAVAVSVDGSAEFVESQRSTLKARLQAFFQSGTRLEILEIRSGAITTARRRLLEQQTVVLVYVVNDTATDTVAGVGQIKVFMSQADVLQALQLSADGAPSPGVSDTVLPVLQVMPYYNDADPRESPALLYTDEGLALILVLIVFFVVLVVFVFVYCLWRIHKRKKRRREASLFLIRNDSLSNKGEDSPVPERRADSQTEAELVDTETDSPAIEADKRRLSVVIKQELDSMLPLPPLLTKRLQESTSSSSTTHHPHQQDKQAALNKIIQEKKEKKKRKKKREKNGKVTTTEAAQASVASPGSAAVLVSENTAEEVESIKDKTQVSAPGIAATDVSSEKAPSTSGPQTGYDDLSPTVETLTPPEVLTAREVNVEPVKAWMTSSDSAGAAAGENQSAGTSVPGTSSGPKRGKFRMFASIFAAFGLKQSLQNAHNKKRASMPVSISEREKQRLSVISGAPSLHAPHKTAGPQLTEADERDINMLQLEQEEDTPRSPHADRPRAISAIRRQSLFV